MTQDIPVVWKLKYTDAPSRRIKGGARAEAARHLSFLRSRENARCAPSVVIAMVPVVAISRAVPIPMAMVTWPDAERAIRPADRAAHRAAGDSAQWTGSRAALRRAALHSSNYTLSMNRDRRGEQSRNRGKLKYFHHLSLQDSRDNFDMS
jgi:hypothetical protein